MTATAAARDVEANVSTFTADLQRLRNEIGKMIVGQESIVEGVVMCLLGGGHGVEVQGAAVPPANRLRRATAIAGRSIRRVPSRMCSAVEALPGSSTTCGSTT